MEQFLLLVGTEGAQEGNPLGVRARRPSATLRPALCRLPGYADSACRIRRNGGMVPSEVGIIRAVRGSGLRRRGALSATKPIPGNI